MIELAEQPSLHAQTTLIGFDLNPTFFPPAEWLAPNLSLSFPVST